MTARSPSALIVATILAAGSLAACDPGFQYWARNDSDVPVIFVLVSEGGFEQAYEVAARRSGLLTLQLGVFKGDVEILSSDCRSLARTPLASQSALISFAMGGRLSVTDVSWQATSDPVSGGQLPDSSQCSERVGIPTGAPTGPGPQPPLLIAFNGGPARDIFAVSTDGSPPIQLTSGPEFDQSPSWSVSGQTIAFDRLNRDDSSDLLKVGLDGGEPQVIFEDAWAPSWSPDGRHITFMTGAPADEISTLMIAGADGGIARPIVDRASPASWSPNGAWLAFGLFDGTSTSALWVVRPDGTGQRKVASGAPFGIAPSWSPDSTRIAYFEVLPVEPEQSYALGGIHLLNLATGESSEVPADAAVAVGGITWSPDARSLLVTAPTAPRVGSPLAIYSLPVNGGTLTQLTHPLSFMSDGWAAYSSDGEWVLFHRHGDGETGQLWLMRPDGTASRELSSGVISAVWQPTR